MTERIKITTGFTWIPNWVFRHPELGRTDREVYLALAYFADNKTRTCFPSVTTLAAFAKCADDKTVRRSIKSLERNGCIEVLRRRGYPNLYYLPKKPDNKLTLDE